MNALASYLRHLIVTGILLAVEKFKLPIDGAEGAADVIALAVVGTVSWWFVKYVAPKIKGPHLLVLFWVGFAALGLSSCSNLSEAQNSRILEAAIPVVTEFVIHAAK
jgi:hypothetical protein